MGTLKNADGDCCGPCSAVDNGNNDYHCPCFNIPSDAKVKNEWIVTSTTPIYLEIKQEYYFTHHNITSPNTISLHRTQHHFTQHITSLNTSLHYTQYHFTQHSVVIFYYRLKTQQYQSAICQYHFTFLATCFGCKQPSSGQNRTKSRYIEFTLSMGSHIFYRGADRSLARQGRKQATATEDFDIHMPYLLS